MQRIAGLPAVTALFATAAARVERLFFEERMKPEVASFCALLARARKPYRMVPPDELAKVAGTVRHGGVVAVARPRPIGAFDPAEAAGWARDGAMLLVLDGIANPHNLGAIARSAAFFGVKRILLSDHAEQCAPSDAAYRTAEGGLDHVALYRAARLPSVLKQLRARYRVVGTALGRGVDPSMVRDETGEERRPVALLLGNEGHGLPAASLAACEAVVSIPGSGAVQSLNVAVSAAILIHAFQPRRDPSMPRERPRRRLHKM